MIFVAGSVNIDHNLQVDNLAKVGQTIQASDYKINFGGKGLNQALASIKLEEEVYFLGSVGNDFYGNLILQKFGKIPRMNFQIIQKENTGSAFINIDSQGQNSITIFGGANHKNFIQNKSEIIKIIENSKIVLLQREVNHDFNLEIAKLSNKLGTPVCLDPAPVGNLDEIWEIIPFCDIITPNETETFELTKINPNSKENIIKSAKFLQNKGIKNIILKLGYKGAFTLTSEEQFFIPAPKVNCIDTVAAGDCFNAGFASALVRGLSIKSSLRFACAVGSLSTTKKGPVFSSSPTKAELKEFLR